MELLGARQEKKRIFRLGLALHAKQLEIDASPARFKIVRAGRKFGKTTYAQKKALDWMRMPNAVHWHIAPTYKQAKLISWTEFKNLIPPEALGKKPNDTDLIITLKNSAMLLLMGSDDPDSLRGPAPTSFTMEEAPYQKGEVWHSIMRPNLMPHKSPGLFIGTPKGFNWFKDLEDKALIEKRKGSLEWDVFHYTVYDNPYLSREEIESSRAECDSEAVWRQEYLAEYEASVGRVFAAFSDTRHVRHVELPVGRFDVYRAIDWGMRDDCACLWAFIQNGRLFVYREYLANNLSAPAQAKIIHEQTPPREKVIRTAISHDAAKEDAEMKGLTVIWHFRNAGISPLSPSSRDKKHSRAMISRLLQENRLIIDDVHCPKLKKQLYAYEWKDTVMEKPDDLGNDDAVDALHYLVEMLQFDLFLDRKGESSLTRDQMYAEIARERLNSWKNPYTKVPEIFKAHNEFGDQVEDTAAGYL